MHKQYIWIERIIPSSQFCYGRNMSINNIYLHPEVVYVWGPRGQHSYVFCPRYCQFSGYLYSLHIQECLIGKYKNVLLYNN